MMSLIPDRDAAQRPGALRLRGFVVTDKGVDVLLLGLDCRERLSNGGIGRKLARFDAALDVGE
ncbi:hypothetical protein ACVWWO_001090 [Bradyrhizobium sp. F1.13.1]